MQAYQTILRADEHVQHAWANGTPFPEPVVEALEMASAYEDFYDTATNYPHISTAEDLKARMDELIDAEDERDTFRTALETLSSVLIERSGRVTLQDLKDLASEITSLLEEPDHDYGYGGGMRNHFRSALGTS